jgi:hypothetical protein
MSHARRLPASTDADRPRIEGASSSPAGGEAGLRDGIDALGVALGAALRTAFDKDRFAYDFADVDGIIRAQKAAAWNEAKGKLRAFAAVSGQFEDGGAGRTHATYLRIDSEVETFIRRIETEGLDR